MKTLLPRIHLPAALLCAACLVNVTSAAGAPPPAALSADYPRAFFFAQSAFFIAGGTENPFFRPPADFDVESPGAYERWEACFSRLGGVLGDVLSRARPLEFFTRFKQAHPEQLVMIHFNGNGRDPYFDTGKFFAGHLVYFNGAKITADVLASAGETDIAVSDPRLFRTGIGRFLDSNDDIGLCVLDENGKPDWRQAEQVQLVAVNAEKKTIRVRRGCFGTKPLSFTTGRAYAAAHVPEGPWGRGSRLLWIYNYSTRSPKDPAGKQCADVLAESFGQLFGPGGRLATFDGVEFDSMHHAVPESRDRFRKPDCDADGDADSGVIDGVNHYGIGVAEYLRKLRAAMGPHRLILADGHGPVCQRVTGHLNGIESEGWPNQNDWDFHYWSDGMNRQSFWAAAGHAPAFSYINHRFAYRNQPGKPGVIRTPDLPWSAHRLVFAAAMFTDSAVTYCNAPPREPGEFLGVWDELRQGTERKTGWLGRPLGPTMRLATQQPDALGGIAEPPKPPLLERLAGERTSLSLKDGQLHLQGEGTMATNCAFRIRDVPCSGPDLFISLAAEGDALKSHPSEIPRLAWVSVHTPGAETPARHMTWVSGREFTSTFYFPDVKGDQVDVSIEIDGPEPVRIKSIRVAAHPDAIYREFERGLIVANPSPRPYTFDLAKLTPNGKFRRLRGAPLQDPKTNDGSPVRGTLTIGAKDALFLVRKPNP